MKPKEGDEVLRRFRISQPYTDYFLTLCTHDRQSGLTGPMVAAALRAEIQNIECDGYCTIRGAVIMTDHIHLLATLHGTTAQPGNCAVKVKDPGGARYYRSPMAGKLL